MVYQKKFLFLANPDYENIMKSTINHSDAVIASEGVSSSLTKFIESSGKPFYLSSKDAFAEAYSAFYNEML
jgi:starch synthase